MKKQNKISIEIEYAAFVIREKVVDARALRAYRKIEGDPTRMYYFCRESGQIHEVDESPVPDRYNVVFCRFVGSKPNLLVESPQDEIRVAVAASGDYYLL